MKAVDVLGKRFGWKLSRFRNHDGDCDSPDDHGKLIRLDKTLSGEDQLRVVIHELTHAAFWWLDETFVDRFSTDVARVLWRLGFRLVGHDKN